MKAEAAATVKILGAFR